MREHTFIGDFDFSGKTFSSNDPDLIRQISKVLRLKVGDFLYAGDGKGSKVRAEIRSLDKDLVEFYIRDLVQCSEDNQNRTILYAAIIKKDRFELLTEKVTEAGAETLVPVTTARSLFLKLNHDRLNKIAKEASEQSGRFTVPTVERAVSFGDALVHAKGNSHNVFFEPEAQKTVNDFLVWKKHIPANSRIGIFIGPEGGWNDEELAAMREKKFEEFSLGTLTLRAETAATISVFFATVK